MSDLSSLTPLRTDSERLDWLQAEIQRAADRGERAIIVLGAWYSGPDGPDGFSVFVGDLEVDAQEFESLRDAIDDAMYEAEHNERTRVAPDVPSDAG